MLIKQSAVITTESGHSVDAYTLSAGATHVRILTLGGVITSIDTPDRNGIAGNIVLGFDDDAQYLKPFPYFGALVGRVANRIARGRFKLDGVDYKLATNNGPNHLHGGNVGYDKRLWTAEPIDDGKSPALRLKLHDADGAEGYPGNVEVTVLYTVSDGQLRIEYEATTDRATPINLTNHSYFNLRDAGASSIKEHTLQAEADQYLEVNALLIPMGDPQPVKGTPIDFAHAKPIGQDLAAMGGSPEGYDHCLVLREAAGTSLRRAATATDPASGRTLDCWTTEPAVQFYSGNFLDGTLVGKNGAKYEKHHGFCLETQHYPDSVNHPSYPSTILKPGATYRSTTEYRFGVK